MPTRGERKVIVTCAVGVLLGGSMSGLGAAAVLEQVHLQNEGVPIDALVTDARVVHRYGGGSGDYFELKYAFTVPGRDDTFTCQDQLGRSDLWTPTDNQAQWQAAMDTNSIRVLYWPRNPHVNRVIRAGGMPIGDPGIILIWGLAIAGVSLRLGWLEVTGRGDHWRDLWKRIREAAAAPRSPTG